MYTKNISFFLIFFIMFPLYPMKSDTIDSEVQDFLIVEDLSLLDAAFCPPGYLNNFNQAREWILDPKATPEQLGKGVEFVDNFAKMGCAPAQLIRGHIAKILNDNYGYQCLLTAAAAQGFAPAISEVNSWHLIERVRPMQIGPNMYYQDPIAKKMLQIYQANNFNAVLQPQVANRIIESYNNNFFTPVYCFDPGMYYPVQFTEDSPIDEYSVNEASQEVGQIRNNSYSENKNYQKILSSISQNQEFVELETSNEQITPKNVWTNSNKLKLIKESFSAENKSQKKSHQFLNEEVKTDISKSNHKNNKKNSVSSKLLNKENSSEAVSNNSKKSIKVALKPETQKKSPSSVPEKKAIKLKENDHFRLKKSNNVSSEKEGGKAVDSLSDLANKIEMKKIEKSDVKQEKVYQNRAIKKENRVKTEPENLKKPKLLVKKITESDPLQKSFEKIQQLRSYEKSNKGLLSNALKSIKTIFSSNNNELKKETRTFLVKIFEEKSNLPYKFYYDFCAIMLPLEESLALDVLAKVEILLGTFNNSIVDISHDDPALSLFQTSGLYELMNEKAKSNPQAAYLLGAILSDRANSNIKIFNNEDVTSQYKRALKLFESNNKLEELSQITPLEGQSLEVLYLDTLLNFVGYLFHRKLFISAVPYLKILIDNRNVYGLFHYSNLVVERVIESTQEEFDSSVKFLEHALIDNIIDKQDDKESAALALSSVLNKQFVEQIGTPEAIVTREKIIYFLKLANMNDKVSRIKKTLGYYTLDEIDKRSKGKKDPQSLYEQGVIQLDKKNYQVAEVFFTEAAESNHHFAEFEIIKMIEQGYISGDWKRIISRLEGLLIKLFDNSMLCENKALFMSVNDWLKQKKDTDNPYVKYLYVKNQLLRFIYNIGKPLSDNKIQEVLDVFDEAEKLHLKKETVSYINTLRLSVFAFMESVFEKIVTSNELLAARIAKNLGDLEYSKSINIKSEDRLLKAIEWMEKAAKLNPNLESIFDILSLFYECRANYFISVGSLSSAQQELNKACEHIIDNASPYIARSRFYFDYAHQKSSSIKYHKLCAKKGLDDLLKAAEISSDGRCALADYHNENKIIGLYKVPKNLSLAQECYIKAAQDGSLGAQMYLYNYYSDVPQADIDFEKAENYFKVAMENPNYNNSHRQIETVYGMFSYNKAFSCEGENREELFHKAFKMINKGNKVNQGDAKISLALGVMYLFGHGVEQSLENALGCFEQGIDDVLNDDVLAKTPLDKIDLIKELEKYKGNIRVDYILGVYKHNKAINKSLDGKSFDEVIEHFEKLLEKVDSKEYPGVTANIYSYLMHEYFYQAQDLEVINTGVNTKFSNPYLPAVLIFSRFINFVYKEHKELQCLFEDKIKECVKLFSEQKNSLSQKNSLLLVQNAFNKVANAIN